MKKIAIVCVTAVFALSAQAQPAPNWGTASEASISVPSWSFQSTGSNTVNTYNGGWRFTSNPVLFAGLALPNGALITGIELAGCDNDAAAGITVDLIRSFHGPGTTDYQVVGQPLTTGAPVAGCSNFRTSFTPEVVDNANNTYSVELVFGATGGSMYFAGVRIYYKLQVSPAPATATFADVPTSHPFFQFIEALAASGVTAGCNASPPQFCPDAPLTRGQMAVFLSRALGLHFAP
jgi:S-layer family protein